MGAWDNMNPVMVQRLQAMIAASGGLLAPGSGWRSHQKQTELYNAWKSGRYKVPSVAKPGTSYHERGLAMDLVDTRTGRAVQAGSAADQWLRAHAAEFGFSRPVRGEAWHVQLQENVSNTLDGNWKYDGNLDDFTQYNMIWGQEMEDDPGAILANRLHAVMRIAGGGPAENEEIAAQTGSVAEAAGPTAPEAAGPSTGLASSPVNTTTMTRQPAESPEFANAAATVGRGTLSRDMSAGMGGNDPRGFGAFARSLFSQYGWNDQDYQALVQLWNRESGDRRSNNVTWNPNAQNPISSAYGIAQFLNGTWAGTGFAKTSDPLTQIKAGLTYINSRYGSPQKALLFHNRRNWY